MTTRANGRPLPPSVARAVRELETWPTWVLYRSGMDRLVESGRDRMLHSDNQPVPSQSASRRRPSARP